MATCRSSEQDVSNAQDFNGHLQSVKRLVFELQSNHQPPEREFAQLARLRLKRSFKLPSARFRTVQTAFGLPGSSETAISETSRPWRKTRSDERGPLPHKAYNCGVSSLANIYNWRIVNYCEWIFKTVRFYYYLNQQYDKIALVKEIPSHQPKLNFSMVLARRKTYHPLPVAWLSWIPVHHHHLRDEQSGTNN